MLMNALLEIGFARAGHWVNPDGRLVFELARHRQQKNILYAFVGAISIAAAAVISVKLGRSAFFLACSGNRLASC